MKNEDILQKYSYFRYVVMSLQTTIFTQIQFRSNIKCPQFHYFFFLLTDHIQIESYNPGDIQSFQHRNYFASETVKEIC